MGLEHFSSIKCLDEIMRKSSVYHSQITVTGIKLLERSISNGSMIRFAGK